MNTNIASRDFSSICRLCLGFGELQPISESDIVNSFHNLINIEFTRDDKLPQNMCNVCLNLLETISTFIETCKSNDELLRMIVVKEQLLQENEYCDNDDENFDNDEYFDDVKSECDKDYYFKQDLKEEIITEPDIEIDLSTDVSNCCQNCGESFSSKESLLEHHNEIIICRPDDFGVAQAYINYLEKSKGRRKKKVLGDGEPEYVNGKKLKGIRQFLCNHCGKNYTRKNGLERHMLTHSGLKPFQCRECGKAFITKDILKTHMLTHLGIKEHKCKVCQKQFTQSSHLGYHMRRHSGEKPHTCSFCAKAFLSSYHLERHKLMHTGVKPYRCEQCGKQFVRSTTLRDHLLIHSGEKPFQCQHCGKQFNRKQSLTNHVSMHGAAHARGDRPAERNFVNSEETKDEDEDPLALSLHEAT
ncbi:unnamed protein product [Phaedon cochleariae]|uniref:Zinc finger protein n=1 Tax=Phaedon cochleariae TaxID=80249 RepID=A0A9P0DMS9_PHACE|nr:unnamed protein product [Phaedon cochleariae]